MTGLGFQDRLRRPQFCVARDPVVSQVMPAQPLQAGLSSRQLAPGRPPTVILATRKLLNQLALLVIGG